MSSISSLETPKDSKVPGESQAWVFAGGEFSVDQWLGNQVGSGDIIVGVDRGIEHCLNTGLVPDILMGDFDSVASEVLNDSRLSGSKIERYSARKSSSDLELALHWLTGQQVTYVTLFGVSGGRSDHHLFNWLLPLQQCWPFGVSFVDATAQAHLVSHNHPLRLSVRSGQTISLLPLPCASGVCTQGLEYALHDAQVTSGSTLGLSNVAASTSIGVSIKEGQLLVFCVK